MFQTPDKDMGGGVIKTFIAGTVFISHILTYLLTYIKTVPALKEIKEFLMALDP